MCVKTSDHPALQYSEVQVAELMVKEDAKCRLVASKWRWRNYARERGVRWKCQWNCQLEWWVYHSEYMFYLRTLTSSCTNTSHYLGSSFRRRRCCCGFLELNRACCARRFGPPLPTGVIAELLRKSLIFEEQKALSYCSRVISKSYPTTNK